MTKTNETSEFSRIIGLNYLWRNEGNSKFVDQSELKVSYEDRFSFLKKYLSTFDNDEFSELDKQVDESKSNVYGFRTMKMPLEEEHFGFELQDDLFEQFFSMVQNVTTHSLLDNSDDQQTFVFNHLRERVFSAESDLIFSLDLIRKVLVAKNEENFAKLVLNLLNVLFLWFDLGILDLHPAFPFLRDYLLVWLPLYLLGKFNQILRFCTKWLKKLKPHLYELVKPHKKIKRRLRSFSS